MTVQPHDPFAVNVEHALDVLNTEWATEFRIGYDGLRWHARRKGGTGDVLLSGISPDDIAVAMRAGWVAAR